MEEEEYDECEGGDEVRCFEEFVEPVPVCVCVVSRRQCVDG